jgi:hypothetical protein
MKTSSGEENTFVIWCMGSRLKWEVTRKKYLDDPCFIKVAILAVATELDEDAEIFR